MGMNAAIDKYAAIYPSLISFRPFLFFLFEKEWIGWKRRMLYMSVVEEGTNEVSGEYMKCESRNA